MAGLPYKEHVLEGFQRSKQGAWKWERNRKPSKLMKIHLRSAPHYSKYLDPNNRHILSSSFSDILC